MTARKILIITNRVPYPLNDGGNVAMNAMIEGYYNAGWQVYLLAMNTSRHYVKSARLEQAFTHLHAFEWMDVNNDIKWKSVLKNFFFSKEPEHAARFYNDDFKQKIKEVVSSFQPDAVQMESVYLSSYLPTVRKYCSAICVLRMHNVEYQIWQSLANKSRNQVKKLYLNNLTVRVRNFERAAWKEYDLLLAITEKDAYQVSRLEEDTNIIVAPFAIDVSKIKLNTGNERWVGYHIGAMDWMPNQKGIHWFLNKVWHQVHKAMPKFEFYFAGRGMPQQFKKYDGQGIHCLDEVDNAEDFIADKKILIVPLWSSGGIRVKILEGMAAGKVVITTSNGIKGIEAMPGEHYLRAQSAADFVKSIKWCLANKEAAEKMAANARKLVEEKYHQTKVIGTITTEVKKMIVQKS